MSRRYLIRDVALTRSLQIYDSSKGESPSSKTRYSTSMLITDLGMGECRIHLAHGRLDDEMNKAILVHLRSLGFKKAQMEVTAGLGATRLGDLIKSEDGLDRYEVDLTQKV